MWTVCNIKYRDAVKIEDDATINKVSFTIISMVQWQIQDFPFGEGRRPPTQGLFGKKCVRNRDNWILLWGGCASGTPWIHQCGKFHIIRHQCTIIF